MEVVVTTNLTTKTEDGSKILPTEHYGRIRTHAMFRARIKVKEEIRARGDKVHHYSAILSAVNALADSAIAIVAIEDFALVNDDGLEKAILLDVLNQLDEIIARDWRKH